MLHIRFSSRHLFVAAAAAVAVSLAAPVFAQDEAALRTYFEGRRVTVKIDMPGTSDGVDLRADAPRPLDYARYGDRLKDYGPAIHAGDTTTVTLVKMKKDAIEFQLGGGGFGTFGDDTSTSVNMPLVEKSSREKDLETRVKNEDDTRRKRQLQRELDDLRAARDRENRRIEAARAEAEDRKKARIADLRLRGGSRFNVKYDQALPKNYSPEDLVAALREYVDFSGGGLPTEAQTRPTFAEGYGGQPSSVSMREGWKGMERDEAEREFGKPVDASERREGSLTVVTLIFVRPGQRITAEFVEDVLIRYSIASR